MVRACWKSSTCPVTLIDAALLLSIARARSSFRFFAPVLSDASVRLLTVVSRASRKDSRPCASRTTKFSIVPFVSASCTSFSWSRNVASAFAGASEGTSVTFPDKSTLAASYAEPPEERAGSVRVVTWVATRSPCAVVRDVQPDDGRPAGQLRRGGRSDWRSRRRRCGRRTRGGRWTGRERRPRDRARRGNDRGRESDVLPRLARPADRTRRGGAVVGGVLLRQRRGQRMARPT